MISVIDSSTEEIVEPHFHLSARRRRVRIDWTLVGEALEAASEQLEWDADFLVNPERRHVEIVIPASRVDHVARTTLDFYGAVADRMGMEEFLSIWVDFGIPR
jgi:hypothetical protein